MACWRNDVDALVARYSRLYELGGAAVVREVERSVLGHDFGGATGRAARKRNASAARPTRALAICCSSWRSRALMRGARRDGAAIGMRRNRPSPRLTGDTPDEKSMPQSSEPAFGHVPAGRSIH
jgi:hypothetical protein